MMRETWYVLEDDTVADPREVAPDDGGVLRHKGGQAVAMGPHGPRSRGVDVEMFGGKGDHDKDGQPGGVAKPAATKDMRAEKPKPGYKTRQTKTR